MIQDRRVFYAWLTMAALAAACMAIAVKQASAHDWYPLECCSSQDCAPVTSLQSIASHAVLGDALASGDQPALPGGLMVTSKHGTVFVPDSYKRRESPDGQSHICMTRGKGGDMYPLCLFLAPGN